MKTMLYLVMVVSAFAAEGVPTPFPEPTTWVSATFQLKDGRSISVSRSAPSVSLPEQTKWLRSTFDLKGGGSISIINGSEGIRAVSMTYEGRDFNVAPKDATKLSPADLATLQVYHWASLKAWPLAICLSAVVGERTVQGIREHREFKRLIFWFAEDGIYRGASFEFSPDDSPDKKEPNQPPEPTR